MTFQENLKANPQDDESKIRECLEVNNIKIDESLHPYLTDEEKRMITEDIRNGLWDYFVSKIELPLIDKNLKQKLEIELREIPLKPEYAHAFKFRGVFYYSEI